MKNNSHLLTVIAALLLALTACSTTPTSATDGAAQPLDAGPAQDAGQGADADQGTDAEVDLTHEIYDDAKLMKIDIVISESDWKSLGAQTKDTSIFVKSKGCPGHIPSSPYTYFPAKVTIDGQVFAKVGVRKKGLLGSQSSTRPSVKIKFHEYDAALRFKGEKRLTLNNNKQDPSRIRTCMAYRMFRRAKIPAPRCTFAKVTVNGQDLGIYSNVEPVKKPFLERHFEDGSGDLYEGTLGDFRHQWTGHLEKKSNEDQQDNLGVDKLVAALTAPDANLLDSLKPHLDVDAFIRFWAMEVLVGHFDGYNGNTNNFYSYYDPTTKKFTFIPWGVDATWNDLIHFHMPIVAETPSQSLLANSALSRRLYGLPETRAKYKAQLLGFVDTLWDIQALHAEIDQLQAFLSPHLRQDNTAKFANGIKQVRSFISKRAGTIQAEISDKAEPKWLFPERATPCNGVVGKIDATLATTFRDKPAGNPLAAGTGTFSATLDGNKHVGKQVGGSAVGSGGKVTVTLVAMADSDSKILALLLDIPLAQVKKGNKVSVGSDLLSGRFVFLGRGIPGKVQLLGGVSGDVEFTEASTDVGGKIELKVTLSVARLGG